MPQNTRVSSRDGTPADNIHANVETLTSNTLFRLKMLTKSLKVTSVVLLTLDLVIGFIIWYVTSSGTPGSLILSTLLELVPNSISAAISMTLAVRGVKWREYWKNASWPVRICIIIGIAMALTDATKDAGGVYFAFTSSTTPIALQIGLIAIVAIISLAGDSLSLTLPELLNLVTKRDQNTSETFTYYYREAAISITQLHKNVMKVETATAMLATTFGDVWLGISAWTAGLAVINTWQVPVLLEGLISKSTFDTIIIYGLSFVLEILPNTLVWLVFFVLTTNREVLTRDFWKEAGPMTKALIVVTVAFNIFDAYKDASNANAYLPSTGESTAHWYLFGIAIMYFIAISLMGDFFTPAMSEALVTAVRHSSSLVFEEILPTESQQPQPHQSQRPTGIGGGGMPDRPLARPNGFSSDRIPGD